jgi:CheY-like chemotaxis protein
MTLGPTVLVAEDNENDVLLLEAALAKAGLAFPLVFAHDGQEAIDCLTADRAADSFPQLLLLDLKMPKYNGFEVLSWIRQQPGLRRMVVVLFTSSELAEDVNRTYDLGANSYLLKPVGVNGLADLIEELHTYWLQNNLLPDCSVQR